MTDPFDDLIESNHDFAVRMATENIDLCKKYVKPLSRFDRHWPKAVYALFTVFISLGILSIMWKNWPLVALDFSLAAAQVFNLKMHRRSVAQRRKNLTWWQEKLEESEQMLRSVDPGNPLIQEVINEEPEL